MESHDVGMSDALSTSCTSGSPSSTRSASSSGEDIVRILVNDTRSTSSSVDAGNRINSSSGNGSSERDLSSAGPDVREGALIIPGGDDVGEGDKVPFGDNSAGSIDAGVQEVDHDSHTSVLVFEADLVNHQGVVGLAAVCLEAGEGKGVAEHVDCLELGK